MTSVLANHTTFKELSPAQRKLGVNSKEPNEDEMEDEKDTRASKSKVQDQKDEKGMSKEEVTEKQEYEKAARRMCFFVAVIRELNRNHIPDRLANYCIRDILNQVRLQLSDMSSLIRLAFRLNSSQLAVSLFWCILFRTD